jgi:uncharacterized protein YheU (UPF0270 family)
MLSPEALHGVIEAFITREGTDYGLHEVPLVTKVGQVRYLCFPIIHSLRK